jgi:hypothetical protein
MATSPSEVVSAILDLAQKWDAACKTQSFFGLTLEQFKAGVQPSLDARAALEALDRQRKVELERRHTADQASLYLMKGVINAIKGDPTQGEDGELYGALGYVRSSMRVNGRSRARAKGRTQPAPAAPAGNAATMAQEEVKTDSKPA